ncbi:hypothetical protein Bbelb_082920 [Branchiostoma belcheri]|nr:hypothetical protein Bbelb_082920 [Branchiostoma belcheri]
MPRTVWDTHHVPGVKIRSGTREDFPEPYLTGHSSGPIRLPEEDTPYSNLCQRYSARVPSTWKVPTEAILASFTDLQHKLSEMAALCPKPCLVQTMPAHGLGHLVRVTNPGINDNKKKNRRNSCSVNTPDVVLDTVMIRLGTGRARFGTQQAGYQKTFTLNPQHLLGDKLPKKETPYSNLCQRHSTQEVPTEAILTYRYVSARRQSSAFSLFLTITTIELDGNPWLCDCRMALFRQTKPDPSSILSVLIGSFCASVVGVVLIGTIVLTVWYKKKSRHPPLGLNPNVVSDSVNTAVSVTSSIHGQTGQSQCMIVGHVSHDQVLAALNPNRLYYVGEGSTPKEPASKEELSAHNPTDQGQSQANTDSNICATATDKMVSGHDKTGQDQSQTISETNTTTTCTQLTNDHDQTGQGQSQTISETNTTTTCTQLTNDHDQTGQGQSYSTSISEKNTTTTCTQLTNCHNQTGQGQSQTISETNTTTTCTQLTNDHDQTGQDQSYSTSISETNATTTCTQLTNGHNQTGQGQSQTISETNTTTTCTQLTNDHDQTGQGQSYSTSISETNATTTCTQLTNGHDQTGQESCSVQPSGMENAAATITASSTHGDCSTEKAILNSEPESSGRPYAAAWCANSVNPSGQWLQVDLNSLKSVAGVITQGRAGYPQWVTSYKLAFSNDGVTWETYTEDGREKTVYGHPSMRMEVLLCAPDCTSDYVDFNGHCYKSFLESEQKTREEARLVCAADGGILAMPKNSAINNFLASLQPVSGGRWLGLTDPDGDGQWVFDDGQILTSSDYSNWQPNDESNGWGCVGFWSTLSVWDPRTCDYPRGFICQIHEATTTTETATTTTPAVTTTTPAVTTTTPAVTTTTPAVTTTATVVTTTTSAVTTTTPAVTTTTSAVTTTPPVTTTASVVTTTMSVSTTTITTSGAANLVTTAMSGEASLTTSRSGEGGSAAANKGEARGGAVAGGVVGAIMAVAGAGLAVGGFLMYKKKKNNAAVEPAP